MNYMDYTDDAAMNMFTKDQCTRMLAVLTTAPWNVLGNSNGCTPVTALDANLQSVILPSDGSSTCNNNVVPQIRLANSGSTTLTSAIINCKLDATATRTVSWTGSLATSASSLVTLASYPGLAGGAHTFSVWVTSPNGSTDQNLANNSFLSTFTVISAASGAVLPFTETFESVTFPPTGWVKQSFNVVSSTNTWARVANATGIPVTPLSTACAKMDNYSGSTNMQGSWMI